MRTEIIVFALSDMSEWIGNYVFDVEGQTAKIIRAEFFGTQQITIPEEECKNSLIKHYVFSKN